MMSLVLNWMVYVCKYCADTLLNEQKRDLDTVCALMSNCAISFFLFLNLAYVVEFRCLPVIKEIHKHENKSFLSSVITERIYPATRKCFIIFEEKIGAATYHNSPLLCNNDGIYTTRESGR